MAIHSHTLPPGTQLENFQIQRVLGVGGFSITYLAKDKSLDCLVAIKEYFPATVAVRHKGSPLVTSNTEANEEFYGHGLTRFLEEARVLAQFKSPYIVRVTRFIEANNTAYIIMEYEDGVSLSRYLLSTKILNERQLVMVMLPLLKGLNIVHKGGMLHRDIKPANIYLRKNGRPVLLDFGAARSSVNKEVTMMTGLVTHGYAPFEQYNSRNKEGPWTDLYGIGATMYRCISGKTPADALERLAAVQADDDDPLMSAHTLKTGEYNSQLLDCIDKMLSVRIKDRPQTIADVLPVFESVRDSYSNNVKQMEFPQREMDWDSELIAKIEIELAKYVGPVAKILVSQNVQLVNSVDELYQLLASTIDVTEHREKFLKYFNSQVSLQSSEFSVNHHSHVTKNSSKKIENEIPVAALQSMTECLTQFIGPVAGMLVSSAAEDSESKEELIERLMLEIPTERERSEFKKQLSE